MMKVCVICECEFNPNSPAKIKAGGFINNCVDCSEESTVKYVGVQAADGKQSQATILKFNSNEDASKYISFWQSVSGLHKGKSCQLSKNAQTDPKLKFETVVAHNPTNHKGKSE